MVKRLLILLLAVSFFIPLQTYACGYRPYSPPGKTVEVSNLSQALISWKDGTEHLVIDPGLTGNAPDFGLLFAFPNKPEISESKRAVFDELENYTLPFPKIKSIESFDRYYGVAAGVAPGGSVVTVIEKKKVGDFDATVLTADTSDALLKWLKKNKYQFNNDDKENFDYYIAKQGYYFVALKISVSDGSVKRISGEYELRPVRFTFQSPQPIFPLRLARDNDPVSKFRIYATSEDALIVPGAGLPFSRFIDTQEEKSSIPSLSEYIDTSTWLTKLDMLIDPSKIEHDLALTQWTHPQEYRSGYEPPLILESEQLDSGAGIVAVSNPSEVTFPDRKISTIEVELAWYEKIYADPLVRSLVISALMLVLAIFVYFYVALALVAIGRRLNVNHRWRAWIPFVNLSLLASLAGKRQWWFLVGAVVIPLIYLIVIPFLTIGDCCAIQGKESMGPIIPTVLAPFFNVFIWLVELLLLILLCARVAARCSRPSWWGPIMILIPPVGLVLLGHLAWSKKENT